MQLNASAYMPRRDGGGSWDHNICIVWERILSHIHTGVHYRWSDVYRHERMFVSVYWGVNICTCTHLYTDTRTQRHCDAEDDEPQNAFHLAETAQSFCGLVGLHSLLHIMLLLSLIMFLVLSVVYTISIFVYHIGSICFISGIPSKFLRQVCCIFLDSTLRSIIFIDFFCDQTKEIEKISIG